MSPSLHLCCVPASGWLLHLHILCTSLLFPLYFCVFDGTDPTHTHTHEHNAWTQHMNTIQTFLCCIPSSWSRLSSSRVLHRTGAVINKQPSLLVARRTIRSSLRASYRPPSVVCRSFDLVIRWSCKNALSSYHFYPSAPFWSFRENSIGMFLSFLRPWHLT